MLAFKERRRWRRRSLWVYTANLGKQMLIPGVLSKNNQEERDRLGVGGSEEIYPGLLLSKVDKIIRRGGGGEWKVNSKSEVEEKASFLSRSARVQATVPIVKVNIGWFWAAFQKTEICSTYKPFARWEVSGGVFPPRAKIWLTALSAWCATRVWRALEMGSL